MSNKKYIFRYVPGDYPTPMIRMDSKPYKEHFEELSKYRLGSWNEGLHHYWTLNAYLIHDESYVKSFRIDDLSNLVWLLRSLNKKLKIEFDEKIASEIEKDYKDEFKLVD